MRFALLLFLSLSVVGRADVIIQEEDYFDDFAECGYISCYDSCMHQFVKVKGNQCGKSFQPNCFHAIGICNNIPGGGPVANCNYKPCYDQCTGRYVMLRVNVCTKVFNPLKGCYQASGTCN